MLLSGDEVLSTQKGNNNGYCQDNELTWFDWSLTEKNRDMLRFRRLMIALRKSHPSLMRRRFMTGASINEREIKDVLWHGKDLETPLWDDPESRVLAFTLAAVDEEESDLHIMLNMTTDKVMMQLPRLQGKKWHLAVDTSRESPHDIVEPEMQKSVHGNSYSVEARAVIVLEGLGKGNRLFSGVLPCWNKSN